MRRAFDMMMAGLDLKILLKTFNVVASGKGTGCAAPCANADNVSSLSMQPK